MRRGFRLRLARWRMRRTALRMNGDPKATLELFHLIDDVLDYSPAHPLDPPTCQSCGSDNHTKTQCPLT